MANAFGDITGSATVRHGNSECLTDFQLVSNKRRHRCYVTGLLNGANAAHLVEHGKRRIEAVMKLGRLPDVANVACKNQTDEQNEQSPGFTVLRPVVLCCKAHLGFHLFKVFLKADIRMERDPTLITRITWNDLCLRDYKARYQRLCRQIPGYLWKLHGIPDIPDDETSQ